MPKRGRGRGRGGVSKRGKGKTSVLKADNMDLDQSIDEESKNNTGEMDANLSSSVLTDSFVEQSKGTVAEGEISIDESNNKETETLKERSDLVKSSAANVTITKVDDTSNETSLDITSDQTLSEEKEKGSDIEVEDKTEQMNTKDEQPLLSQDIASLPELIDDNLVENKSHEDDRPNNSKTNMDNDESEECKADTRLKGESVDTVISEVVGEEKSEDEASEDNPNAQAEESFVVEESDDDDNDVQYIDEEIVDDEVENEVKPKIENAKDRNLFSALDPISSKENLTDVESCKFEEISDGSIEQEEQDATIREIDALANKKDIIEEISDDSMDDETIDKAQIDDNDKETIEEISDGPMDQEEQIIAINEIDSEIKKDATEEISDGSIDQGDQNESDNNTKSATTNLEKSEQGRTRTLRNEPESLEDVFFATENDDVILVTDTIEDKDNDEISDASFSDHMSLEEISDDDEMEVSKKRRKSLLNTPEKKASNVVDVITDEKKKETSGETDCKSVAEADKVADDIGNKRRASGEIESSDAKKTCLSADQTKSDAAETKEDKDDNEPAFYTGVCGRTMNASINQASKTEPKTASTSEKPTPKNRSVKSKSPHEKEKSSSSAKKKTVSKRYSDFNSQTDKVQVKGKIVQCSINQIKPRTVEQIKAESLVTSSELFDQFAAQIPSSINKDIFSSVATTYQSHKDIAYSVSLGPVTLSDMDNSTFRDVALKGLKRLSLVFDKDNYGVLTGSVSSQQDVVHLVRGIKRASLGNRYMVLSVTYNKEALCWSGTLVLMFEQDSQQSKSSITLDGKVRGEVNITGIPQGVSKDFVHIFFPEALSISAATSLGDGRGMNLGFSSTILLDQIHTTYDLLVINGSKVKLRGKNSIIHSGQNKGFEEEAGVVTIREVEDPTEDPSSVWGGPAVTLEKDATTDSNTIPDEQNTPLNPSEEPDNDSSTDRKKDNDILEQIDEKEALEAVSATETEELKNVEESIAIDDSNEENALHRSKDDSKESTEPEKHKDISGEVDLEDSKVTEPMQVEEDKQKAEIVLEKSEVSVSECAVSVSESSLGERVKETVDKDEQINIEKEGLVSTTDTETAKPADQSKSAGDSTAVSETALEDVVLVEDDVSESSRDVNTDKAAIDVSSLETAKTQDKEEDLNVSKESNQADDSLTDFAITGNDDNTDDASKDSANKIEILEDISDDEILPNQDRESEGDDVVILAEDPFKKVVAEIDLTVEETAEAAKVKENIEEEKTIEHKQDEEESRVEVEEAPPEEISNKLTMLDGQMEVEMEVEDVDEEAEEMESGDRVLSPSSKPWFISRSEMYNRQSASLNLAHPPTTYRPRGPHNPNIRHQNRRGAHRSPMQVSNTQPRWWTNQSHNPNPPRQEGFDAYHYSSQLPPDQRYTGPGPNNYQPRPLMQAPQGPRGPSPRAPWPPQEPWRQEYPVQRDNVRRRDEDRSRDNPRVREGRSREDYRSREDVRHMKRYPAPRRNSPPPKEYYSSRDRDRDDYRRKEHREREGSFGGVSKSYSKRKRSRSKSFSSLSSISGSKSDKRRRPPTRRVTHSPISVSSRSALSSVSRSPIPQHTLYHKKRNKSPSRSPKRQAQPYQSRVRSPTTPPRRVYVSKLESKSSRRTPSPRRERDRIPSAPSPRRERERIPSAPSPRRERDRIPSESYRREERYRSPSPREGAHKRKVFQTRSPPRRSHTPEAAPGRDRTKDWIRSLGDVIRETNQPDSRPTGILKRESNKNVPAASHSTSLQYSNPPANDLYVGQGDPPQAFYPPGSSGAPSSYPQYPPGGAAPMYNNNNPQYNYQMPQQGQAYPQPPLPSSYIPQQMPPQQPPYAQPYSQAGPAPHQQMGKVSHPGARDERLGPGARDERSVIQVPLTSQQSRGPHAMQPPPHSGDSRSQQAGPKKNWSMGSSALMFQRILGKP